MKPGCYFDYYEPLLRINPDEMFPQPGIPAPQPMTPSDFEKAPGSPTDLGTEYTQGYLRTQIGKRMRVTFLLGTNTIQDRTGILRDVGISYIVLREEETNSDVLCDIYSIKFVNIFQ